MAAVGADRTPGSRYRGLFLLAGCASAGAVRSAVRCIRHLGRMGRAGELPQLVERPDLS